MRSSMTRTAIGLVLSSLGAAVGAAVGIAVTYWFRRQGFYAMILPGACLGLGANLASIDRSTSRGLVFGVLGLAVGLVAEWLLFPGNDPSLGFFLKHLPQQVPVTWLMLGLGAVFAYWWGREASPWASKFPGASQPLQVKRSIEGDQG